MQWTSGAIGMGDIWNGLFGGWNEWILEWAFLASRNECILELASWVGGMSEFWNEFLGLDYDQSVLCFIILGRTSQCLAVLVSTWPYQKCFLVLWGPMKMHWWSILLWLSGSGKHLVFKKNVRNGSGVVCSGPGNGWTCRLAGKHSDCNTFGNLKFTTIFWFQLVSNNCLLVSLAFLRFHFLSPM